MALPPRSSGTPGQDRAGELSDGAGHLDAGRAGADHHERQPSLPRLGVVLELGRLECIQDPPAEGRRVLEGLQARRDRLPVIAAEVVVADSGRQHQRVIGEVAAAAPHNLADKVEGDDLLQEHLDVALPPEDRAERRRDVRGGQHPRRDLVEERLEHVMVASVEERDLHRGTAERFRGPQARESASDDHDPVDSFGTHGVPSGAGVSRPD